MLVEKILTSYLKYKFSKTLTFSDLGEVQPPRPDPGRVYLLYVHIPYCEELCPYCSFNRFPYEHGEAVAYFKALRREIQMYGDLGFNFRAVYVGGGTPTILPDEIAEMLLDIRSRFNISEVSLETNPNHLTEEIAAILKDAGVNRLSVGVQSFDDGLLKQMERYHKYGSGAEIKDRLKTFMGRFDTLNVDMIFNFPTQTLSMLENDLDTIEDIKADQVTFYPLMVSDITRRVLSEKLGKISYDTEKKYYYTIADTLEKNYGFGTAWCFSRRKRMIDEYIVDYDEYAGLGSGSFGYVGGACYANTFSVPEYVKMIEKGKLPLMAKRGFSKAEQINYDFMMKLFGTSLNLEIAEEKFDRGFAVRFNQGDFNFSD